MGRARFFDASVSLSSWASRIQPLWDCYGVALWCCTFAQYQPEDGAGPSLQHQLSLDPFKSVIHSKPEHGMLVVHTTKADPYDRLWCVHEVDEALESKLFVIAIGTYYWVDELYALAERSADMRLMRRGSERSSKAKMGAMSVWTGPSRPSETHC